MLSASPSGIFTGYFICSGSTSCIQPPGGSSSFIHPILGCPTLINVWILEPEHFYIHFPEVKVVNACWVIINVQSEVGHLCQTFIFCVFVT